MLTEILEFTDDKKVIEYFSRGQCHALAYEIHKLTGWSLVLVSDLPVGSDDYCGHMFVVDSDGFAIDIKGRRTIDEVKDDWWFCEYIHRFFSLKDFEYEMQGWTSGFRFDRDRKAKQWAKYIVDILQYQ